MYLILVQLHIQYFTYVTTNAYQSRTGKVEGEDFSLYFATEKE